MNEPHPRPVTRLLSQRVWGQISSDFLQPIAVVGQCPKCSQFLRKDVSAFQKVDLSETLNLTFACCESEWDVALSFTLTARLVQIDDPRVRA